MDILELIATHSVALVAGAVAMHCKDRWRRTRRDQGHLADAAREIVTQLRSLTTLVAKSRDVEVKPAEIVDARRGCATAIIENQHRLPTGWRHLRRSTRAALGEHFGGPAWAHISYGEVLDEVAAFDGRWWDYALSYFKYVAERLARVADRPEAVSGVQVLDFDTWLAVTDRHGQMKSRHLATRNRRRLRGVVT